jgi:site-specific recombinase XerD
LENIKQTVIDKILFDVKDYSTLDKFELKSILERNLDCYKLEVCNVSSGESNLQERMDQFLNIKTIEGLADKSIKRYKEELNIFIRYINKSVEYITIDDLRNYFSIIQKEKNIAKTTINNKISIIKSFFDTMVVEGVIPTNPAVKLKRIKVDLKSLRTALDVE